MFVTLSPWRSWGHGYPECIPKFCNNQPDQPQISYQENWNNCLQNPENHQTKNLGAGPHWLPYYYFMVFYYHIHAKVILTWFPKKHPWNSHHKISTPITSHKNVHFLKLTVKKHLKIDVYSCKTIYFPLGAWNPAYIFTTEKRWSKLQGSTYSKLTAARHEVASARGTQLLREALDDNLLTAGDGSDWPKFRCTWEISWNTQNIWRKTAGNLS